MQTQRINYAIILMTLILSGCATPTADSSESAGSAAKPNSKNSAAAEALPTPSEATEAPRYSGPLGFTDVTAAAGVRFKHNSGAYGKKYLPETMGSGCAFLDYDNDGWQDILLVNGMNWPDHKGAKSFPGLYHNNRNGTFTDVTKDAGLMSEMYGLGCAVGDYDNDGNPDIFISCLGADHLFRNLGNGKFSDVTAKSGASDPGFSTSAAWLDFDKDGKLDLFVCNYVDWSIDKDLYCTLDGKNKSYCDPKSYKGQSPTLLRNRGDGTFENVTARAGLNDPSCKSLGVSLIDYNGDGWMDLLVANDTQPNKLYKNNGNGTFSDEAMAAGVAFSEAGVARAGMGVDAADYDRTGRQSVIIGNFSNEMMALYHNEGNGLFIDEAPTSTIGQSTLLSLTFSCFFFDFDLDGLPDIFAANGHVMDDINRVQPNIGYAQAPHLFRNVGNKKFELITTKMGRAIQTPAVARGAAYGDIDNDGDLDLLITSNNGAARLLRNDGGNQNNLLRVKTVGSSSNRDGIGAKVTATLTDNSKLWCYVKTGSSYCSQSELPVTFGLGKHDKIQKLEIVWPSGKVDILADLSANHSIIVQEGKGLVSDQAISFGSHQP